MWQNPLVTGLIGLLVGALWALIEAALAARSRSSEQLRDLRLAVYPQLWLRSAPLSFWPRSELTWDGLKDLHIELRRWYFSVGGMVLSERSRARYGDVQELLNAQLARHSSGTVAVEDHLDLARTYSALRTSLTEDLSTRRQRSLLLALRSWRWHRRMALQARARLMIARGEPAPRRNPRLAGELHSCREARGVAASQAAATYAAAELELPAQSELPTVVVASGKAR
jgi:hypothetical protein